MLRFDFYESGVGETIIVTFPDESIAVIDAHPSTTKSRPSIIELVRGSQIRFVCLTHPHQDHGLDLIPILDSEVVGEFWHTMTDIIVFVENISKTPTFLAPGADEALDIKKGWARFVLRLLDTVFAKQIPDNPLRNDLQTYDIAGVKITVGWPNRAALREYIEVYLDRLEKPQKDLPDHNSVSAVLIFEYADRVVLLGADALKNSWTSVKRIFHERKIPKASVLKVPHHGAINALHLHPNKNRISYLELCEKGCYSILFAGDVDHPDLNVKTRLKDHTDLKSLFNIDDGVANSDPLKLAMHGGSAVETASRTVAHPRIAVTIDSKGKVACACSDPKSKGL